METSDTISGEDEDGLPPTLIPIAARAAVEGIPVAAIARALAQPMPSVYATLKYQLSVGNIVEIPRADWPPTAKRDDRVPTVNRRRTDADVDFACRRLLKLTPLEAAFMTTLIKVERADKSTLHQVIEAQRYKRQAQPDTQETTDPKMVDVIICKLRKKLTALDGAWASAINTIWGGGYYIEPVIKSSLLARLFPDGVHDGATEEAKITNGSDPTRALRQDPAVSAGA